MAGAASQWTQRQDYTTACDWSNPHGRMAYRVPRPVGDESPLDVTSFHPGQWNWDSNSVPDILYTLSPPQGSGWHAFRKANLPAQKVDAAGQGMFEQWPEPGQAPRALLDFRILPDRVSFESSILVRLAANIC